MPNTEYGSERALSFTNATTLISLVLAGLSFAYTFGVVKQRVDTNESAIRLISATVFDTPAMKNELQNIDRRLTSIEYQLQERKGKYK